MANARQRLDELDEVVSAIAHASRRQILMVVRMRGGELSSGDIAARFHHKWPTISRHLRVLEDAGLLSVEKQGRIRLYRVNNQKLDLVREWLAWFEFGEGERS